MSEYNEVDALLEEADRLETEYEAARDYLAASGGRDTPLGHPARRRFRAAQQALADARRYWRQIGEAAPDDHPGTRWPVIGVVNGEVFRSMVKVENNTNEE